MTPEQIKKMAEGCPPSSIGKDHEEVVTLLAETHIALQEQVQKLATENAALKDFAWSEAVSYDMEKQDRWMMECNGARDRYRALETPATDAAMREIGAKAVDAFGIYHNFSDKQLVQVEAKKYAAKLRAGEQP